MLRPRAPWQGKCTVSHTMTSILHRRNQKVVAVALAVLVLATGFCLFDGDEDEHAGLDLCLGMLVATTVVAPTAELPLAGLASIERFAVALNVALGVPAPPPKLALS